MRYVYKKGQRKATISNGTNGRYILDVDKGVRVSCHHHVFKDFGVMFEYLDWLFGKYEIRSEG